MSQIKDSLETTRRLGKRWSPPPPSAFCAAILWLLMPPICIHITLLPPPFSSILSNQSVIDQKTSYNLALISWCDSESLLTSVFIRSKISHLLLATCLTHKTWFKTTEINRTFRFAYYPNSAPKVFLQTSSKLVPKKCHKKQQSSEPRNAQKVHWN